MAVQIQIRRGTAQQWFQYNPILAEGELAVELDTEKFKIGNGVNHWNDIPYATGIQGPKGDKGDPGIASMADIPGVNITSLADGSILKYDGATNQWVSSTSMTAQIMDSGQY
jgi:hypothetical protein